MIRYNILSFDCNRINLDPASLRNPVSRLSVSKQRRLRSMSSPIRLDPFGGMTSLREAMDQLMGQAVLRPGFGALAGGAYGQMNVLETDGKYLVQAALPGINPEGAELTVRQNTLTLKVKVDELLDQEQLKGATYLLHEFGAGEFSRTISFP